MAEIVWANSKALAKLFHVVFTGVFAESVSSG